MLINLYQAITQSLSVAIRGFLLFVAMIIIRWSHKAFQNLLNICNLRLRKARCLINDFSARHVLWLWMFFASVRQLIKIPLARHLVWVFWHGLSLFSPAVSSARCACWAGRLASYPASFQANLQDRCPAGYRPTGHQKGMEPAWKTVAPRGSQGQPSQKAQAEAMG